MITMKRIGIYGIGIFLFALGVAFAIKSDLGVSPVSSLPYVVSIITGMTVGTMTAALYGLFVVAQWLMLRKNFKATDLLQLVFAVVFGSCVDLANYLIRDLRVETLWLQIVCLIVGTLIIAYGIFLILKTQLTVSPTDGLVKAISRTLKVEFPKAKVGVDLGTALVAILVSFFFLGQIRGVGPGTIISALSIGSFIHFFERIQGQQFEQFKEVEDV